MHYFRDGRRWRDFPAADLAAVSGVRDRYSERAPERSFGELGCALPAEERRALPRDSREARPQIAAAEKLEDRLGDRRDVFGLEKQARFADDFGQAAAAA